jgi:hypothetical protein
VSDINQYSSFIRKLHLLIIFEITSFYLNKNAPNSNVLLVTVILNFLFTGKTLPSEQVIGENWVTSYNAGKNFVESDCSGACFAPGVLGMAGTMVPPP